MVACPVFNRKALSWDILFCLDLYKLHGMIDKQRAISQILARTNLSYYLKANFKDMWIRPRGGGVDIFFHALSIQFTDTEFIS